MLTYDVCDCGIEVDAVPAVAVCKTGRSAVTRVPALATGRGGGHGPYDLGCRDLITELQ